MEMMRVAIVLALCVTSASTSRVPAGTTVALTLAALAGFAAVRLRATAEILLVRGNDTAAVVMRLSRFLHDLALALSVLGLLYAVRPV
jgi:hypothetical protein